MAKSDRFCYFDSGMKVNFLVSMALVVTILLGACMIEQKLILRHGYSGVWILEGRPMPFVGDALEDLAILGGYDNSDEFYDEVISETITNLEAREDIENFEVGSVGKDAWKAYVEFEDIRLLLGDADLGGIAAISRDGDIHTLSLKFDRARAAELERLLPILKEPTFSLFNPAESEGFSEEEYTSEVLGFTFGEENLSALQQSMVQLSITVPGTVVEVEGGTRSGESSALFEVPFTRILVPEGKIAWMVSWRDQP